LLLGINGQTLKNEGPDSVRTSDSEVQSHQSALYGLPLTNPWKSSIALSKLSSLSK